MLMPARELHRHLRSQQRAALAVGRFEGPDLSNLIEEGLNSAKSEDTDPEERDGFAHSSSGDTAYVFILRDDTTLLGALGVSCQDGSGGARPFTLKLGLLRPALQVLSRELISQY
jgi:hypothetical protein